ncbi:MULTISPECIES: hypothetical protein [unclassified Blastomonas]|jgi:hypothetical protein|uniref:Gldg family protein n=2 Tax=Pseudomonadota TaxID=1224 RepID=UPI00076ACA76|nr:MULTISPECIES: hypothetical protein [unclassified Blastomonas]MAF61096.1 hypothetical protein [Blastomonas sp.]|tara:strand:+ start:35658 stop:36434 length:777 start_codon:yes stop_codon:yes gene_type:complete
MRAGHALAAASLAVTACVPASSEQPAQRAEPSPIVPSLPRQKIALMSSLPLVYGAGVDMADVIAGKADPHPLHAALAAAHDLVVPDALDAAALKDVRLAILVQPRALGPDELVALDDYVRAGGRLLLFADPQLDWPHGVGLADPRGPQRTSLISPLLRHWGLELQNPGIESVRLGESGVLLVHPGQFGVLLGKSGDGSCHPAFHASVVRCSIGKGRAVIVADADLLDPQILANRAVSGAANRTFIRDLLLELMQEDSG